MGSSCPVRPATCIFVNKVSEAGFALNIISPGSGRRGRADPTSRSQCTFLFSLFSPHFHRRVRRNFLFIARVPVFGIVRFVMHYAIRNRKEQSDASALLSGHRQSARRTITVPCVAAHGASVVYDDTGQWKFGTGGVIFMRLHQNKILCTWVTCNDVH